MEITFEKRLEGFDGMIEAVESWPDIPKKETALELVRLLMDFHGAGFERVMDAIAQSGKEGLVIFDRLAADELTSGLLTLYGLHPLSVEERIAKALDVVRPSLSLHDGDAELVSVDDGVVSLKLKGNCSGCPSSLLTLKSTIESAILNAAPDVTSVRVVDDEVIPEANGFVQLGRTRKAGFTDCEFAAAAV